MLAFIFVLAIGIISLTLTQIVDVFYLHFQVVNLEIVQVFL